MASNTSAKILMRSCLVCCDNVSEGDNLSTSTNGNSLNSLEHQVFVVYIVNKLLDIPLEICSEYLEKYGDPTEWIWLCDLCKLVATEAQEIWQKMKTLEKQHKNIQEEMRLKIKVKRELTECQETGDCLVSQSGRGGAAEDIRNYLDLEIKEELSDGFSDRQDVDNMDGTIIEPETVKIEGYESPNYSMEEPSPNYRSDDGDNMDDSDDDDQNFNYEMMEEEDVTPMKLEADQEYENVQGWNKDSSAPGNSKNSNSTRNNDIRPNPDPSAPSSSTSTLTASALWKMQRSSQPNQPSASTSSSSTSRRKQSLQPRLYFPKKGSLSFSDVCQLRADLISKRNKYRNNQLPPAQMEEIRLRKNVKIYGLAYYCRKYHVEQFPCLNTNCRQIFTLYQDWDRHFRKGKCGQKEEGEMTKQKPWLWPLSPTKKTDVDVDAPLESEIKCGFCSKVFQLTKYLENHLRLVHYPKRMSACRGCDAIYPNVQKYADHVGRIRREIKNSRSPSPSPCLEKALKCQMCRVHLSTQEGLDLHLKIRHLTGKYKCPKCQETFREKSVFLEHMDKHSEERNYLCDRCGSKFLTMKVLKGHVFQSHLKSAELKAKRQQKLAERKKKLAKVVDNQSDNSESDIDDR